MGKYWRKTRIEKQEKKKVNLVLRGIKNTDEEEILDWNPVPPKTSIILTMKAQYKGRKKPMKYVLDNDNE